MEIVNIYSVVEDLKKTYGRALQSYSLHRALSERLDGLDDDNQSVENFDDLLGGIKYSLEVDHIIQIAKFFDIDGRTSGVAQLKKFHETWEKDIDALFDNYSKETIKLVKDIRNNYVGHSNWDPPNFDTKDLKVRIEKLLPLMREAVDIASRKLKRSTHFSNSESRFLDYAKSDIENLFDLIIKEA